MNQYVTGAVIKELREKNKMTQLQLAERIGVSDKTVSKWETGRGYPDISLLEPLAAALGISVLELLSGDPVRNRNRSADMTRSEFYICPVCSNVIRAEYAMDGKLTAVALINPNPGSVSAPLPEGNWRVLLQEEIIDPEGIVEVKINNEPDEESINLKKSENKQN